VIYPGAPSELINGELIIYEIVDDDKVINCRDATKKISHGRRSTNFSRRLSRSRVDGRGSRPAPSYVAVL
jgi:hypothetical protein